MTKEELIKALQDSGENAKLIIITDNPFEPLIIELKDIESVKCDGLKSVVDLINESKDMQTALKYVSGFITPEEQQALDNLNERLLPQRFAKQIDRIESTIEATLRSMHSNLRTDEVLSFLCENVLGIEKIATMLDNSDEIKLLTKLSWAIEKLENIEF